MSLWPKWYRPPTGLASDLIGFVAREFGVSPAEVKGAGRNRMLVGARSVIAVVLREQRGLSYPTIGRMLGGRDHSTIQHSHRTFHDKAKCFPDWQLAYLRAATQFGRPV